MNVECFEVADTTTAFRIGIEFGVGKVIERECFVHNGDGPNDETWGVARGIYIFILNRRVLNPMST